LTTPIESETQPASGTARLRRRGRFVKQDIPLGVRAIQAIDVLIALAFANPLMKMLIDWAAMALLTIVVTSQARSAVDETWFSVLVFILVIVPLIVIALQHGRVGRAISRLELGPPGFGELGGLPKRLLRTTIKASKGLRFELGPEDAELMEEYGALAKSVDEALLRKRFLELEAATGADPDRIEADWKEVWENELLAYRVGDATLRDTYNPLSLGAMILPLRLTSVSTLVAPMILVFQFVVGFLAFRALTGGQSWVTVFQVGLLISFILTSIIYLNHVTSLQTIELLKSPDAVLDNIPEDLREKFDGLVGRRVVPIRVKTAPLYFRAIRDYFAGGIALATFFNALAQLLLVAIALIAAIAAAPGSRAEIVSGYGTLALAFVVIPFAIVASFYAASVLIQQFRSLTAGLLGGLATALLPLGLTWIVNGDVPSGTQAIILAAVSGVVGTFATVLGTHLKERLAGSTARPQPAGT